MNNVEAIKQKIVKSQSFRNCIGDAQKLERGGTLAVRGVAGSLIAFVTCGIFEKRGSQVLLVATSNDAAEKLRDDCVLLLGEENVRYFGARSEHQAQPLDATSLIAQVESLKTLSADSSVVVVASAAAVAAKVPRPERFTANIIDLRVSSAQPFSALLDTLTSLGFERKEFVEGYGDFSVRGGILDVFPYIGDNPLRLEFWGDTIDSIREFDILSQRSIRELQSATIVPAVGTTENAADTTASIFDYLKQDAFVVVDEPEVVKKEIDDELQRGAVGSHPWEEVWRQAKRFPMIVHSIIRSERDLDFGSAPQPSLNGSVKLLVRRVDELNERGLDVYIMCDTADEADRLRELIEEERTAPAEDRPSAIPDLKLHVGRETVHSGFVFPEAKLAVFTEHEFFGRLKRRGSGKRRRLKGFTQKELGQLKRGDYVVHADYGIGRFAGLKKVSVGGSEQEAMKIVYQDNDTLYVNLNFIDRVEKYSSREGHVPKISRLGAPDWERLKSRARRRIKDLARDLIRLYAQRKHEKGFTFSSDTHWQKEMEASFLYEDTQDQARAVGEVKRDMESEAPMDRLVCGDVGFGKTEVAVRAAFKAIQDGKQAAILVPTTILAQQHFNTLMDRLGRYPVRIEFISRFKSRREQDRIIGELRSGNVDILIGTHRLLSKDVAFKNLGLLIIDEEHRFGVASKEKLRSFKATVDTLTLTATPIPRTLHFSLMGARDISLINTPPRNRLPIVTEIVHFDWGLIREAILRELHRGGQVYFVHDRIQRIEEMVSLLEEHIPEARCVVAHGQMKGHQLEKVMVGFLEKKFDVLVCTKIIESGIDIPNVNTIIINRADRFGMAELYQLRGRVGRSNVQAYAYLLTPPVSVLPRDALRRLQAVEEFTELASGFNLAMRDMEIRGTGNLLGAEQSGFILDMGYETYERIVKEAVDELKQEELKDIAAEPTIAAPKIFTIVDAGVDAYIPEFYLESDVERLELYRRLSHAASLEEVDGMRSEINDRFGEYPPEVENLFLAVELRLLGSALFIARVDVGKDGVVMTLPDTENPDFYAQKDEEPSRFQKLLDAVRMQSGDRFRLKQEKKTLTLILHSSVFSNGESTLQSVKQFLRRLGDVR